MSDSPRRQRPPRAVVPLLIWEGAWKALAIRRAVQLKKYRWIPVLAAVSSGGVLPIWFILHNRNAATD